MPVEQPARPAPRLRSLEIAYGLPLGPEPDRHALEPDSSRSPRQALEDVVRRALERPPCVVSFSGGLDSSALLGLATAVARRDGLPDPVPATLVFPGSAESDEDEWQRLVLARLQLDDALRIKIGDELDAVGPYAQRLLRRHGLVWPFNLHFHLPIADAARGGTVLTGYGGDELGRTSASRFAERAVRRYGVALPRRRAYVAFQLLPAPLKAPRELARPRHFRRDQPWLTTEARLRLQSELAKNNAHPFGWGPLLRTRLWRSRYVQLCRENFRLMGEGEDVHFVHPFTEPEVIATLGEQGRWAGLGSRADMIKSLLGDVLPPELLTRTTKAAFSVPLWTTQAEAFAARWSGNGLDQKFVDPDVLRRTWLTENRSVMCTTLLQAAWLADDVSRHSRAQ